MLKQLEAAVIISDPERSDMGAFDGFLEDIQEWRIDVADMPNQLVVKWFEYYQG